MPPPPDPNKWFLQFSKKTYGWQFDGDGRPWGDGTKMAAREKAGKNPWDEGCKVTPLIGGYEAMFAMRESLELAIGQAPGLPEDQRGHVYIADWRFNPLRDLSEVNDWKTKPWADKDSAQIDQTAIGLVLRLMQAGVKVRILLWLPVYASNLAGFREHIKDHFYTARIVYAEISKLIEKEGSKGFDRGIVALDIRVAEPLTTAHHQKMMVIRVGDVNVAYVGGVDLAFTRRDAPDIDPGHNYTYDKPQFLGGDWQSGKNIKNITIKDKSDKTHRWPKAQDVNYDALKWVSDNPSPESTDLPKEVYGDSNQIWHDHHLKLEGPIVKTIEEQFCERWIDYGKPFSLSGGPFSEDHWRDNQVIFSTGIAFRIPEDPEYVMPTGIIPLPEPKDVPQFFSPGSSSVQMWRTIPLRKRKGELFTRGEFTVMAGISNASKQATEMIWIFDQYFWSRPLAKLLNYRLRNPDNLNENKNLYVIIVLPPYADDPDRALDQHHLRKLALNVLTSGLQYTESTLPSGEKLRQYERVGVYNLWHPPDQKYPKGRGIYCHTKVQMYDSSMLVCGSANLNRRSLTCDTELDCAVLDPFVVDEHQKRLWRILFPNATWPSSINFDQPGWGKKFFDEFQKAANSQGAFLIPDPWWNINRTITRDIFRDVIVETTPPKLPNGEPREQDFSMDYLDDARKTLNDPNIQPGDYVLKGQKKSPSWASEVDIDNSSIELNIETNVCPGRGASAVGRLDEIVFLIEGCDGNKTWPSRRTRF